MTRTGEQEAKKKGGKSRKTNSKSNKKGKSESEEQLLNADNLGLGGENIEIDASAVQNNNTVCLMKKIRVDRLQHCFITVAITWCPWLIRDDFLRKLVAIAWKNKYPEKSDAWIDTLRVYHPRGDEHGDESRYRRKGVKNSTYDGLTFTEVFPLNEKTENVINSIKEKVEYIFRLLQKRDSASCGELFLDYLMKKPHDGLLKYYKIQCGGDHDRIHSLINEELHSYASRGIEYQYDEHYDKCFVDFDIKGILKNYAGVNDWRDASEPMKKAVYKYYPARKRLPNWDAITQEPF